MDDFDYDVNLLNYFLIKYFILKNSGLLLDHTYDENFMANDFKNLEEYEKLNQSSLDFSKFKNNVNLNAFSN